VIDPAILATARRVSHLASPHAHLLRAVIAELDDTRRHLIDARVQLDQAQAHALETDRRRCLGGMPRESTTDWANHRLPGGHEAEYAHLNGWKIQ
jgi:hypothetical protein